MCEICNHKPCHPQCPNAEEDKPVLFCTECDAPIWAGERYQASTNMCEDCVLDALTTATEEEF